MNYSTIIGLLFLVLVISCSAPKEQSNEASIKGAFPYEIPTEKPTDRPLSAAMERFYDTWNGYGCGPNELYSTFFYTPVTGLDYRSGDGTVSRRDPSKVLKIDGKYYVWYTHRKTEKPCVGPKKATEDTPSFDWDLCEIWYATSKDGFHWEEQGLAVERPAKPEIGWRSVCTPDVLHWKGKYYLYYQSFVEIPGKRGDFCPVSASVSDSPDGPWTPAGQTIINNGAEGEWDQFAIHDPYPLIYKGKIYLYYKSNVPNYDINDKIRVRFMQGLATSDHPFGPFEKHPLNPVLNSGHETGLFPFKEGIAAMTVTNGPEMNCMQYAPDGVNFELAAICDFLPAAPGPFVPDAFADNGDGRGITWGLTHSGPHPLSLTYSLLFRFDCDLSLDYHNKLYKKPNTRHEAEVLLKERLNPGLEQQLRKSADLDKETIIK